MKKDKQWLVFFWRVSSCHIVSYLIMGIVALLFLNYNERYSTGILVLFMRSTKSSIIALAPILQIIRGIILSTVLWFFKDSFLKGNNGWLKLWGLLVGLTILGTSSPAPGSLEGLLYTKLSISEHILFLPEGIIQTLLFSLGIYYWYKKSSKAWNLIMSALVILTLLMSVSGYLTT